VLRSRADENPNAHGRGNYSANKNTDSGKDRATNCRSKSNLDAIEANTAFIANDHNAGAN
jgi:hypothetical protein